MASPTFERLRAALAAMPPGTLVPRDWVLEQLSEAVHGSEKVVSSAPIAPVDLSIRGLAQLFGKQSSTVRAWVERGDFPGAYKLNGKEWRVPLGALEGFQDLQRQRSRPTSKVSAWRKVGHPKATTQP
jgi:hypothetical protein